MIRTFDYRIVKRMSNSYPVISSDVIYLIDNQFLWGLKPFKAGYLISRNDYLPAKGKEGKDSARRMRDWMFENTEAHVLYAQVHQDNRPARHSCVNAGMIRDSIEDDYIYYKVIKDVKKQAA